MKRALLVGIDEYDQFQGLDGCVNDVDAIEPLLSRNEDSCPNFASQKRTSATGGVTRDAILGDLDPRREPLSSQRVRTQGGVGLPALDHSASHPG